MFQLLSFTESTKVWISAVEVKQEVEMHLPEKEILEGLIPSNIIVGPFYTNTENVRQALSKKRKALSNVVLELLAKKLRTQADDVSVHFQLVWFKQYFIQILYKRSFLVFYRTVLNELFDI